uniref:Delta-aminolevulinic acid dehydratase n=1 Tax=Lepidodinium chlorophorum TaxID=107758 RepID=A0A1Q1MKK5_LEPCH|nr:delta-aminolevulinate dehydratase [Lepidodinium chlorophorum]
MRDAAPALAEPLLWMAVPRSVRNNRTLSSLLLLGGGLAALLSWGPTTRNAGGRQMATINLIQPISSSPRGFQPLVPSAPSARSPDLIAGDFAHRPIQYPASRAVEVRAPVTAAAAPRVPEGTPQVEPLPIRQRPRRNRRSPVAREMFAETVLTAANFIWPVFVHDGEEDIPISSMPGVSRLGVDTGLLRGVEEAVKLGVKSVVIFPKTPDELKTPTADEAYNPEGLAQRAIRNVKQAFPEVVVYTDIALDPYNSLGHDGIVRSDGVILNDETIHQLCKQAVSQAEAGADYVSPSDMMDGRIGAIRDALDAAGYSNVGIMAYTAKYASAFYGPFREALDSNPRGPGEDWVVPPDKKTYQQNPANWREALIEARLDEEEGADILMVKPGMPYLDIIKGLHDQSNLPIAAYHVSGEYAMLKAAALNGWLDEKAAVMEALLSLKRAGATVILTYYALQAAKWLKEDEA